jgi:peptidoglycan/xylan/chitin deacetylase (PgdA/CDA1 family)
MHSHVADNSTPAANQPRFQGGGTHNTVTRLIKLAGSVIYFLGITIWRKAQQLQGKPIPGSLVVLCYHAIPQRQRARFGRQMDLLQQYARPTRIDVETPMAVGEHYAAVTFDDAYQSAVENALPELRARNIPCTVFVVSHQPAHSPWWAGTDGYDREDKFVTEEQLANLPSELVTIGSHTMTHARLPALSEEMARQELFGSRQFLEQAIRREIRLFAFPHGAFSSALVTWCREAGYKRVFSTDPTTTVSNLPEYVTGRVAADATDWMLEFRLKVLGAYHWLAVAYKIKRRVRAKLKSC